jgi:hypothetical protein
MKTIAIFPLVIALAGSANAQGLAQPPQGPPPEQGPGGPGPEPGNMTPGEIQKLFDAYIVVEAQRALELGDAQYPQFIAKLRALQDTRRRNQQERMQLMQRLVRMTAPRAPQIDNSQIETVLKNLQELESRTAAETRKAYDDLDQVLDVRQRARFRVLEEQVERRKIELLTRARQQNRPVRPKLQ